MKTSTERDLIEEVEELLAKASLERLRLHEGSRIEVEFDGEWAQIAMMERTHWGYPDETGKNSRLARLQLPRAALLTAAPELLRRMVEEVKVLRKRIKTMERDAREDAQAAANEARWQERQGEDYGSY